jgi:hypothetical protein
MILFKKDKEIALPFPIHNNICLNIQQNTEVFFFFNCNKHLIVIY